MALTLTQRHRGISGNRKQLQYSAVFDAAYVANGELLAPSDVGLIVIDNVQVNGGNLANAGVTAHHVLWNRSQGSLQLYETGSVVSLAFDEIGTDNVATVQCELTITGH